MIQKGPVVHEFKNLIRGFYIRLNPVWIFFFVSNRSSFDNQYFIIHTVCKQIFEFFRDNPLPKPSFGKPQNKWGAL